MAFQFPDPQTTPEFTADNGITYSWDAADGKWQIKSYAADFDDRYVNKKGGDEMEGPFKVLSNPNIPGSRDARKIETYGVFSGSSNTALRFGTNRDRIYVGDTDTSFNGLVKIDELSEKNTNNGIKVQSPVKMNQNQIKNLAEATQDKDAVNYGQVKQELTDLRDEFIQDLIVGTWGVDNVQSLVTPGTNRMCFVKSNGQAATKFSEATVIRFFYKDDQGSDVLWDNWDPGELVSFRQLADPSVTATFRLLTSANSNGNARSFSVDFVKSENDTDPFGEYMERYAVTLTEFSTPVDPGALDDLYLRLDANNSPVTGNLTYTGPTDGDDNVVTRKALADALSGSNAALEHSPYIANMQGTKSGVNSNTPGPNEVAGFYTSSTADGSRNEYPGNFNSLLKCGAQIVSVQEGTNDYAELLDGHDERWTGTVSVLDKDSGGLLYKNTIVKVTRSGEYIYIWVREPGSERGNKPMFAFGSVNIWTNIAVLIEGYQLKG